MGPELQFRLFSYLQRSSAPSAIEVTPQGAVLAQACGDRAVPSIHRDPSTYTSSSLWAAGLWPRRVPGIVSCVTVPTPESFLAHGCLGPQRPDVWGNHHRATWFRPGQPEQEEVAAAYRPRPRTSQAGLQDEACPPLEGGRLDLRKHFLMMGLALGGWGLSG